MTVLTGTKGPHRDIVLANATLGLLSAGKARTVEEGVKLAEESIDSGRALEKLHQLKAFTNS
jgi:anthranilate phosphoribosyltransferase